MPLAGPFIGKFSKFRQLQLNEHSTVIVGLKQNDAHLTSAHAHGPSIFQKQKKSYHI